MTIDLWTLAFQAINVGVLIWLLSRVFWTPVANAIAERQAATQATLDAAAATQAHADAALVEVETARAGIVEERTAALTMAEAEAEAAAQEILATARAAATALTEAATAKAATDAETARAAADVASATLAVAMARKLLAGLDTEVVQTAFLARLVAGIAAMTPQDRAALVATHGGIDLVSPADLDADSRKAATAAVQAALGDSPRLNFVTDPALIAGGELRTPHFTLHNSWRADLDTIEKALTDAA